MKGVVWGSTFARAKEEIENIEDNYKRYNTADLVQKRVNRNSIELIYDNGDMWRSATATESSRGIKCNISYIDHTIATDFIDTIRYCTTAGPF